mgnify:CR=1 FL=1
MKINTAFILCAGFGKRLNPITLKTPKPLLKLKNLTMLERCININEPNLKTIFLKPLYGDASGVRGAALLGRENFI